MGKYTSLAQQLGVEEHNKEDTDNKYVKINSIDIDTTGNATDRPDDVATPLRPYAVNAVIRCIHNLKPESCCVCSGYVRWLVEDEGRLRRARARPEETRREYWQLIEGGRT